MTAPQHLFIRIKAGDDVTAQLNALAAKGWRVVSHADDGHEYSFVLIQAVA